MVGERVRWISSTTGREHTGTVVLINEDAPKPYLLKPDGDINRWTAWEKAEQIIAFGGQQEGDRG